MFLAPLFRSWHSLARATRIALLVLLCFLAPVPTAAADTPAAGASGSAVVAGVTDIMGNRTRMIQVGAVFVAVGVFLLVQKYR